MIRWHDGLGRIYVRRAVGPHLDVRRPVTAAFRGGFPRTPGTPVEVEAVAGAGESGATASR